VLCGVTLTETPIDGAFVMQMTRIPDDRGFFAEAFHRDTFTGLGLDTRIAQMNVSYNDRQGTLRGMHYQIAPHEEVKIVRCVRGSVFDVVLDLRRDSPTFGQWAGAELSADNRLAFYVPAGCAHGYQTLTDDTEVLYMVSNAYSPAHYRGLRWNDPFFNVAWPETNTRILHPRDESYPDFQP